MVDVPMRRRRSGASVTRRISGTQHGDDLCWEKGEVSMAATASTRGVASCGQWREKGGGATLIPGEARLAEGSGQSCWPRFLYRGKMAAG
jgi:hypothetical protein